MNSIRLPFLPVLFTFLLLGCSAENAFHLRQPVQLSSQFNSIRVHGLAKDGKLFNILKLAFNEAGIRFFQTPHKGFASSQLLIENLHEGKRVVAYDGQRKAREYLLFLRFDYVLKQPGSTQGKTYKINLDRSFLYDADFVLGKREEERQLRERLYKEAARLILLNLKYGQQH
jgi:outer membrane lipopolysaccharide assembly protein LptE/RlpB